MRYESAKTASGNVGVSYESQEAANAQAASMDANDNKNCVGCSHCSNCSYCSYCSHCSNCSHCSDCLYCSDCSDCSDCWHCSCCLHYSYCTDCSHGSHGSHCSHCAHCTDCSYCSYCSQCSHCSGILKWTGERTERLLAINGLQWPLATNGKQIQIGCECHAVDEWESFDDYRIVRMAGKDSLRFWREFKPTVMAMARYRASLSSRPQERK